MDNDRGSKKISEYTPPGKQKQESSRRLWNEGIREAMLARNLEEEDAFDTQGWRKCIRQTFSIRPNRSLSSNLRYAYGLNPKDEISLLTLGLLNS